MLRDHSVSDKVITQRAHALRILGEEFVAAGVPVSEGLGDVKERFGPQVGAAKFNFDQDQSERRSSQPRSSRRDASPKSQKKPAAADGLD